MGNWVTLLIQQIWTKRIPYSDNAGNIHCGIPFHSHRQCRSLQPCDVYVNKGGQRNLLRHNFILCFAIQVPIQMTSSSHSYLLRTTIWILPWTKKIIVLQFYRHIWLVLFAGSIYEQNHGMCLMDSMYFVCFYVIDIRDNFKKNAPIQAGS